MVAEVAQKSAIEIYAKQCIEFFLVNFKRGDYVFYYR
ncbi:MAG: hypothetical protein ACJAVI_004867 [Candidatus Azotimanducaceae bacterium]|jgi:hypothetical protein